MVLIATLNMALANARQGSSSPLKRISSLLDATRSVFARASIDLAQRRFEIGDEFRIRPIAGHRPGDNDVIDPRPSAARQHLAGNRAQSALRAIADHRVADLSARGETNPYRVAAVILGRPRRGLQNETWSHRPTAPGGDMNKIGAGLEPYKAARHRYPRSGKSVRLYRAPGTAPVRPKTSGG
jgi:hypothetical protein